MIGAGEGKGRVWECPSIVRTLRGLVMWLCHKKPNYLTILLHSPRGKHKERCPSVISKVGRRPKPNLPPLCVPGLLMWAFWALYLVFTVCYPVLSSRNVFSWCCFFLACKGFSYITLLHPWYLFMETENTYLSHMDCISTQFKPKLVGCGDTRL